MSAKSQPALDHFQNTYEDSVSQPTALLSPHLLIAKCNCTLTAIVVMCIVMKCTNSIYMKLQEKVSKNTHQSLSFFALCEQIQKIHVICSRILALYAGSSPCRKMERTLRMRLAKYRNESVDTFAIIWILLYIYTNKILHFIVKPN